MRTCGFAARFFGFLFGGSGFGFVVAIADPSRRTNLTILTANDFDRLTIKTIKRVALSANPIAMLFRLIGHTV